MRGRMAIGVIIAVVLLAGSRIPAQQSAPLPAGFAQAGQDVKSGSKKKSEEVIGKSDYMKTAWGDKKTVLMKGNVKFTHDDTLVASEQVDYDQEAKIAVSPGKIVITDPECDITGDKGSAYFKRRLGVVEGNVVMHLKPKPEEGKKPAPKGGKNIDDESVRDKLKQPSTVTCAKLEYQYRSKIATATGGVIVKQEKRTASADKVIYDEKKELLTLIGNVKGIDEYGQTFSAPGKVVISTKKGDEWMEAPNASATFKIDLDEEEGGEKKE